MTLHVGNYLSKTLGTHSVGEALTPRLAARGHSVITTSSQQNRVLRLFDMLLTTWRRRRDYQIAEVAVFSGAAFFWAESVCALLRALHKPYVLSLHGGNLATFAQRHPRRVERLIRSAERVTTPSHRLRETFLPIRPDLMVMPNGINLSSFTYRERQQIQPRIAWLRAIHSMYAPQVAVEAVARLVVEFPQIELALIGPDKDSSTLRLVNDTIERLGVGAQVRVVGAVPFDDVPDALASYDIFLNTTTVESFGVSLLEAAAQGMCIVTTTAGELPYIWTHDEDALLVPPEDPEATAAAIRRLVCEPGLAARLSRNARRKAEGYDWSAIVPRWERLFEEVKKSAETGSTPR